MLHDEANFGIGTLAMGWIEASLILFGGLVAVMGLGLPVAFAFLAINILGAWLFLGGEPGLTQLARNAVQSVTSFSLTPIPFFVLMGEVLFQTGLAMKAIDAFAVLIRRVPGRLSVIVDMLIPPSALTVLLGSIAGISISGLLIGGIVPGLILSVLFVGYIITRAVIDPSLAPNEELPPAQRPWERWRPFIVYVLPLVAIFAVVVGAMTGGFATPTEAAALGAAATMLAAICYRALTARNLMKALTGTVAVSGTILFIILGATIFSQVLSFSGATNGIVTLISGQGLSATAIIIGMMLILLFLGCFVDQVSMMLITLPFFMPLVQKLNIEPIWFGVMFLICMQLGLLTPPFGLLLFTMKGVAPPQITMPQIYAASVPYMLFGVIVLAAIFLFPPLATWLPRLLSP
jgi:tripartite ATP-independent transporter DctM subunit